MLRLRSDEQLVALFRAGNDDAFRTIHDRYRQRLFAYTRQMLPGRLDAEDALQDVFVRAYSGLRANDRDVALRAWLYRVAHNRCVDELRRPLVSPTEVFDLISAPSQDPAARADQRESLRRLIADVRRLPHQQRSALLMRELSGMSYAELADALETTVPAVKSLLVRARMALAQALEARDASCTQIREGLILAQDNRVRPNAMARRHMRDCPGCREFRRDLRGVSRQLAALAPTLGPIGVLAKLIGVGVGSGAGGGTAAAGGVGGATVAAGGAIGTGGAVGTGGAIASAGALATGAGHVATLLVATMVTAGGAVEIQNTIAPTPVHHHRARHAHVRHLRAPSPSPAPAPSTQGYTVVPAAPVDPAPVVAPAPPPAPLHPAVSAASATATPTKSVKTASTKGATTKGAKGAKSGSSQTSSTSGTTGASISSTSSSSTTDSSSTGTGSTTGTGSQTGTSGTDSTTTGTLAGTTSSGTSGSTSSTTTAGTEGTSSTDTPASSSTSSSGSSTSDQSTSGGTPSPTGQ